MRNLVSMVLISFVFATGCASTKVETTGSQLKEPLCRVGKQAVSTLVYWGPQWRPDQKEPELREAAALRGIQDFLNSAGCVAVAGIHRLSWAKQPPSNEELLRLVAKSTPQPERVLLIVVRELGPQLIIGIPTILEGGTEVLIDVRVLNPQTSELLADTKTLWRNGGKFVIKGVKTLDKDISSALSSVLIHGTDVK
jgi:hypothetical protein